MLAPVTHMLPLTNLLRARLLPTTGRVLARVGQKVKATDVIADSYLQNNHILMDIGGSLGITDRKKVRRYIDRKIGEKLQKGDVIAEKGGLFRRVVRAPANGEIVMISGGQVLFEMQRSRFKLYAGYSGKVTNIIPERGAIVKTSGALIQGVWGNDRINQGLLFVLGKSPDEELTRACLDENKRRTIVLAGHCAQVDAIQAAAELPLRGLILGSISSDLISVALDVDFPIILLEGFGRIPINEVAYQILMTNDKRVTTLNAVHWNAFKQERPEVVIPLPATGNLGPEIREFTPGQTVRIQSMPYPGQVGTLEKLLPGISLLPSGLRVPAAEVRLEGNKKVMVPIKNMDVLE